VFVQHGYLYQSLPSPSICDDEKFKKPAKNYINKIVMKGNGKTKKKYH